MAPRTQHVALVIGALVVLALALTFVWTRPSSSSSSSPSSELEPKAGAGSACAVRGPDGVDHPIMTGKEWRDLFRALLPGSFTIRVLGPDSVIALNGNPGAEDYVPSRINLVTMDGSEDACVIRAFVG